MPRSVGNHMNNNNTNDNNIDIKILIIIPIIIPKIMLMHHTSYIIIMLITPIVLRILG